MNLNKEKIKEILLKQLNECKIEPMQYVKLNSYVEKLSEKKVEKLTEQYKQIGQGLSKLYKYSGKAFKGGSTIARKLKLPDVEKAFLNKWNKHYNISQTLRHNPSPENVREILLRLRDKAAVGFVVGLIILYAYKKYVRNLSAAGRYCKGTSGSQRTACLRKYKIKVLKERVMTLENSKMFCGKSKDPKKCEIKINEKIKKLKERISVLQTKEEQYYENKQT